MKYLLSRSIINNAPADIWPDEIITLVENGKITARGVEFDLTDQQCATLEQMINNYSQWLRDNEDLPTRATLIFSAQRALDQLRHRAGNTKSYVPDGGTKWVCPQCERWIITFVPLLEQPLCGKHTPRHVRMLPLTQP